MQITLINMYLYTNRFVLSVYHLLDKRPLLCLFDRNISYTAELVREFEQPRHCLFCVSSAVFHRVFI